MLPLSLIRPAAVEHRRSAGVPLVRPRWPRPANTTALSVVDSRSTVFWAAAATIVGIAIALGHVWLRLQVVEVGYRLSTTRQVIQRLEGEGQELLLAASRLDAPNRLDGLARTRLGMVAPEKGQELALP
ncbi:cell division protein FtsL [Candidatus Binatia bacterium]|nr:cell division protein FtsL [Candidatus Binatia bacterium]